MYRVLQSDFLAGEPSFASGLARLIDFGCSFDGYNESATALEADTRAMTSDWLNVGYDILDALFRFEHEEAESETLSSQRSGR